MSFSCCSHENGGFTVWKFQVTESDPEDLEEQEEFKVGLPLECERVSHSMLDDETETDSLECTGVVGFAYMQPTGDENQLLVVAWNAFRKSVSHHPQTTTIRNELCENNAGVCSCTCGSRPSPRPFSLTASPGLLSASSSASPGRLGHGVC